MTRAPILPSLARAARADREQADAARMDYEQNRGPTTIERLMADGISEVLGVEIHWRLVRDLGYRYPYYVAEITVDGLTFTGHYLSDTNGLHRTSSPWKVTRTVGRVHPRTQTRMVDRLGDLDGWLDSKEK